MDERNERILITDLERPTLSPLQQQLVAQAQAGERVPLTEEAILAAAMKSTELADFGPDDFRERLQVWLQTFEEDDPNNLGRRSLFERSVRYASNRLRIHDLLERHPEVHDQEIPAPVIVTGPPRSGTTHLVNILAADERFQSLPLWESFEPVPYTMANGTDPRYQTCAEAWKQMQASAPLMASMHPMVPDHIHEEVELQCADFSSFIVDWWCLAPRWRDYYLGHDQTPHYAYLETVLKLLQWVRGDQRRWVLKSPQHVEQLEPLMTTFPDATVVFTHRDPVSVIQSNATMVAYSQRVYHEEVDARGILDFWIHRTRESLSRGVRDRDLVPGNRSLDVMFQEFMSNQMGTIRAVYEKAGLEVTDSAEHQLATYIDEHPRGKGGRMTYDLRTQFGVTPEEVRKSFGFYFDRFPVQVSVR